MNSVLFSRRKYMRRRTNPEGAPASVEDCIVTLAHDSYPYTGQEITPQVTVTTADGVPLAVNVDYFVSYGDNVNVGAGTVIVSGTGAYVGTVVKTFQITSAQPEPTEWDFDLNNASFVGFSSELPQSLTAKDSLLRLVKDGADSELLLSSSINGHKIYSMAFPTDVDGEYHVANIGQKKQADGLDGFASFYITGVLGADETANNFIAYRSGANEWCSFEVGNNKDISGTKRVTGEASGIVGTYLQGARFSPDGTKMYSTKGNLYNEFVAAIVEVDMSKSPYSFDKVTADDVRIINIPNTSEFYGARIPYGCLSFSPSGKQALMLFNNDRGVRVLRLYTGEVPFDLMGMTLNSEFDYRAAGSTNRDLSGFIVANKGKTIFAIAWANQYSHFIAEINTGKQ